MAVRNKLRNTELTDLEVVDRVLAGDIGLFEILMRRNNQKLFRIIRSYLNDEEEIADIMQNTYLKAYEKLTQFNKQAQFSTWLIRIGINESLGRLRFLKRLSTIIEMPNDKTDQMMRDVSEKGNINPEKKMIRQEVKGMLENAIDQLPAKYKIVFVMAEIEDMPIADVADCLNLTTTNVKVRIHRARLKLKESLFTATFTKEIYEFGFTKCDRIVASVMKTLAQYG